MATVATKDLKAGMVVETNTHGDQMLILSDAALRFGKVTYGAARVDKQQGRRSRTGGARALPFMAISGKPDKKLLLVRSN